MVSPASVFGESGKSTSESSLSCSFSSSGSDESELEESRESEHGAIEPYMYEPVANRMMPIRVIVSDEPEVEERRHSTEWYVF